MNKYELIYIIDTAAEETTRKELIEKFNGIITANGGEVVKVEEWGKRRLAYAIDYKTAGYYVYVSFNAGAELPKELTRNCRSTRALSVLRSSSCWRRRAASSRARPASPRLKRLSKPRRPSKPNEMIHKRKLSV